MATETKVDIITRRIEGMRLPETITNQKDMEDLLTETKEVVADFNELQDEAKAAIFNLEKLLEIAAFFQDKNKIEEFRKKYVEKPKKKKKTNPIVTENSGNSQRVEKKVAPGPQTREEKSERTEKEKPGEEKNKTDIIVEPIPFINLELDYVQGIIQEWDKERTEEEEKELFEVYSRQTEIVKAETEKLISEYRENKKKAPVSEATESELFFYNDEVDSLPNMNEDTAPLWSLENQTEPKKSPFARIKEESTKKEKIMQHKKDVIVKNYKQDEDFYASVQPADSKDHKKKKLEKEVVIKGIIMIGFIVACVIGTVFAISSLL